MFGIWRDRFPRLVLKLPDLGGPQEIEFVIDTGFDGDLSLPESVVRQLDITILETRFVQLAGGLHQRCYSYEFFLEWNGQQQPVEVLTLDDNPLLGNGLWDKMLMQVENSEGGEVPIE